MSRTFEDRPATRESVPLLLGVAGPSGSGKTFSALRLAAGMQRVIGGDVWGIDTEARRMLHYADRFKFQHVDFRAPFGPLDYMDAINHCVAKGAKIIVTDSMTHEHNGEGGVMDQIDKWLDAKAGDDENARQKLFMGANKAIKPQRQKLNNRIVQLGLNAIFCYRANDVVKPVQGKGIQHIGWQPETTSKLIYEMAQCFLLGPGSDGIPTLNPETVAEKMLTKNPAQFRDWFEPGTQLNEDIGQKMAEWARGGASKLEAKAPSSAFILAGETAAAGGLTTYAEWFKALAKEERVLVKDLHAAWKKTAEDADDRAKTAEATA